MPRRLLRLLNPKPLFQAIRRHQKMARWAGRLLAAAAVAYLIGVVVYTKHVGWKAALAGAGCAIAALIIARAMYRPARTGSEDAGGTDPAAALIATAAFSILSLVLTALQATATSSPPPVKPSPILTTRCGYTPASPASPVIPSNEGQQVIVAQLFAAVAGNVSNPAEVQEYLNLYGYLDPLHISRGDSLFVLGTWDASTHSFFPQKGAHPAGYDVVTFVRGQLVPDAHGCFTIPIKKWGNPGTFGQAQDFSVLLASPKQSTQLLSFMQNTFNTGTSKLKAADVNKYGTEVVKFTVSTDPYCVQNSHGSWTLVKR
jgi:hypothetical protein